MLVTVPLPDGGLAVFFDAVGDGCADDAEGDGSGPGSARSSLREARSPSVLRLATGAGLDEAASTCAATGVSVAGPMVMAAAAATTTTIAMEPAAMSGTDRRGKKRTSRVIRVEKPRGTGRDESSACLPDKIEPFVGDKAGGDAIDNRAEVVKSIMPVRSRLRVIFPPIGRVAADRSADARGAYRRWAGPVNLG